MNNNSCRLCGGIQLETVRNKLRHGVRRKVLKCRNCGLVFLEPKNNFSVFYKKDYRRQHSPIIGRAMSSHELFDFSLPLQKERVATLKHILKPNFKVLDIGSSAGHFLYALKNRVKEVMGIELNQDNVAFTSKELGLKVCRQPIEKSNLPKEYFDLVTAWQTFEHVEEPLVFLRAVNRVLKPGGFLLIEVPNADDALLSVYGLKSFADFWYTEPHSFYYTASTLKKMLSKGGFSGRTKTKQSYNFINHLNWKLTGQPQGNYLTGTAEPQLVDQTGVNLKLKNKLNRWFQKVDKEYKLILNKHGIGTDLLFIGQKVQNITL